MSFRKYIRCLYLAALLLAGLFMPGSPALSSPDARGAISADWSLSSDDGDAQHYFTQAKALHSAAHVSGGGHFTGDRCPGMLPMHTGRRAPGDCSKSALKQRRYMLLEHFTYQQVLSLFPKHGFW